MVERAVPAVDFITAIEQDVDGDLEIEEGQEDTG